MSGYYGGAAGGYPPPQGYGAPPGPPQGYGAPPGPPQGYGAPPGPPQGYGASPGPPQGYGAPPGPPQGYGAPSGPPQGYGAPPGPPQGYGAPGGGGGGSSGVFYLGIPVPPPPPNPPLPAMQGADISGRVERIYKAMRGFGTDDKTLIAELCSVHDPFLIDAVRTGYKQIKGKDLMKAVEGDVSGWYEAVLRWQVYGPVMGDVIHLKRAMAGAGTDDEVLTEILIGRSNNDIYILKSAYQATFGKSLEAAVLDELSYKTKRMFAQALAGARQEHAPVDHQQVEADVQQIYQAMRGGGTDEDAITSILMSRSNEQLVAIAQRYRQAHHKTLSSALEGDFSGHMQFSLLYLIWGAEDPMGAAGFGVQRDVRLIHDAVEGAGTKDRALVRRVCRATWNRARFQAVKQVYHQIHQQNLATRIKRETTGNYEKSLVMVVETA